MTLTTTRAFDVFALRNQLVGDYRSYLESFLSPRDERIRQKVDEILSQGMLWPEPLLQMNPSFEPGGLVDELVDQQALHAECRDIFRLKSDQGSRPMRLHRHQVAAIHAARAREPYVLTTGTGSGKSLSYIVPIVDWVLRQGSGQGLRAIIIYPMNALANSQWEELSRFLHKGYESSKPPVTFARYTGQEDSKERDEIRANPPDILLTNYVMLELILTRPTDKKIIERADNLSFLVLDELHTYRGRQGADVALLIRRLRERCASPELLCVGTSATLAGGDTRSQQQQVAEFASRLFGVRVKPERVIGETLKRTTPEAIDLEPLKQEVRNPKADPCSYEEFVDEQLSRWIESSFGLTREEATGKLIRRKPASLTEKARELAEETGLDARQCEKALQNQLLRSYAVEPDPVTGRAPFAFRLHQFFSKGDTLWASLEDPAVRYLTLEGQQFVPGDRSRLLFPVVFCRECGQEYYSVWDAKGELSARRYQERAGTEDQEAGYLYLNPARPWPDDPEGVLERIPDEWLEDREGRPSLRDTRKHDLPVNRSHDGLQLTYLKAPFRFCLSCGVAYDFTQKSDVGKLSGLDSGGRSTATTLLTVGVLKGLREHGQNLKDEARKLLCFTDNRQDASLQAGHFNDFVQVGWLRSALYRAVRNAGQPGIRHDELTHRVFESLSLSPAAYAQEPEARFQAKEENERALREVLGYRLYRDLMRGWRVTFPNLEQSGLLRIDYLSLSDLCQAEDIWEKLHPALRAASASKREELLRALLDYLRRELALKVDYLDRTYQEKIKQLSSQRLQFPWSIEEEEMQEGRVVLPRGARRGDPRNALNVSARGAVGRYLRRRSVLGQLKLQDVETILPQLFLALKKGGLVSEVLQTDDKTVAYQVVASAMVWRAGEGKQAFHDPIRVPQPPQQGPRVNDYFVRFYSSEALPAAEAREHTAQVTNDEREKREHRFREGRLDVLYCSPTMELGVDIAELNVVGMRNVPPTPANYAQRSGRAGRSGQPALVFTYCTAGSPHDQYFFRRSEQMVAGSVSLPRLDLANEELVAAHVRSEWLAATEKYLGTSMKEVVDANGTLDLLIDVRQQLERSQARTRARQRAHQVLQSLGDELHAADWFSPDWLESVLNHIVTDFDRACDRWRELYRSALGQMDLQHALMKDSSRSHFDKQLAEKRHKEAHRQRQLLLQEGERGESDFNPYRYLASEGFLPGYNFPRLPLSAYIPARRAKDEFVSRPRFLAIAEFGPRSILYHEGARYITHRVMLNLEGSELGTRSIKICPECGYNHPLPENSDGVDLCERCEARLDPPLTNLFRMRNVVTRRRDRIHCDEEERTRMGFELRTTVRFERRQGRLSCRNATVQAEQPLARLSYGQAACLWRINLGWKRRKKGELGFWLDLESGHWATNDEEDDDRPEELGPRREKVVPYVEDHRNSLLIEPLDPLDPKPFLSLQWAIKNAIQLLYQLEDNELAAEPLPSADEPRRILLYESAEGGAGVLRRLVEDADAMARVARAALEICHFDPITGEDRGQGECEAACYRCLWSYSNQVHHQQLDRKLIYELLSGWRKARTVQDAVTRPRSAQLAQLMSLCDSQLERRWLVFLEERQLNLPDEGQGLIADCGTRPDFYYAEHRVCIYVDGPVHLNPSRAERDRQQQDVLDNRGYTVIRFRDPLIQKVAEGEPGDDWESLVRRYAYVFGEPKPVAPLDLDLWAPEWHSLIRRLQAEGQKIEPPDELATGDLYVARLENIVLLDQRLPNREALEQAARAAGLEPRWVVPD